MWTSSDSLPSSITISWYRVAAWDLASKVIWKLSSLAEKQHVNVWHFPDAWLPNLRQQSAMTLSMCIASITCICIQRGGTLPNLPTGTSRSMVNDPVCSQGEWWWEANFLRRKLIPGGLPHLDKREVASDTHEDHSRSAVLKTLLTGWATVRTFQVPGAHGNSLCQGHKTFLKCQGHELLFRIVIPHHQCWMLPSQVWLALFYCHNPTPNQSWGTTFKLFMIYCI